MAALFKRLVSAFGADTTVRIPNPDLATAVEVLSTGQPKTGMVVRFRGRACRWNECLLTAPPETIHSAASAHPRRDLEDPQEH